MTVNAILDAVDPNALVIVTGFASADGAEVFMADPSLREAMANAGVDSAPMVSLCDEAELKRSTDPAV